MNYHLAANGKDSNDGRTEQTAWATWVYAKPKLVPGDTLFVYDGIPIEPQAEFINVVIVGGAVPPPPTLAPLTLVPSVPTHGKAFSVVVVQSGGVPQPSDWLAIFPAGAPKTGYMDWKYLSNTKNKPAAGVRPAIVTLMAPALAGSYELRFLAAGSTLLGMVPFTV